MKLHHIFQDLHVCGTSSVSQLRRVVLQHFAVKLAAFSFFRDQQHWILSEQTSLMFVYNFLKTVYKPDFCWWLTRSPWEHTVSRRQTAQRRFGWRKTKNKQTGVNLFIRVVAGPPATDSGFTQFWDVKAKWGRKDFSQRAAEGLAVKADSLVKPRRWGWAIIDTDMALHKSTFLLSVFAWLLMQMKC